MFVGSSQSRDVLSSYPYSPPELRQAFTPFFKWLIVVYALAICTYYMSCHWSIWTEFQLIYTGLSAGFRNPTLDPARRQQTADTQHHSSTELCRWMAENPPNASHFCVNIESLQKVKPILSDASEYLEGTCCPAPDKQIKNCHWNISICLWNTSAVCSLDISVKFECKNCKTALVL